MPARKPPARGLSRLMGASAPEARHSGQAGHCRAFCSRKPRSQPGNVLPAPRRPPNLSPAILLFALLSLALPDRNAYKLPPCSAPAGERAGCRIPRMRKPKVMVALPPVCCRRMRRKTQRCTTLRTASLWKTVCEPWNPLIWLWVQRPLQSRGMISSFRAFYLLQVADNSFMFAPKVNLDLLLSISLGKAVGPGKSAK
jgi:hypothetical protein